MSVRQEAVVRLQQLAVAMLRQASGPSLCCARVLEVRLLTFCYFTAEYHSR